MVAFVAVVSVFLVMVAIMSGRHAQEENTTVTDPDAPLAAFYGDSYTLGTGASDPALRWSSVIAAERGWREFNPSVNGLGFVNNRSSTPTGDLADYAADDEVPQIVAQNPDIVFVTMGLNDNFSMPARAADIEKAIDLDLTTLRAQLPDARFIVVEPFWYTDERPDSVEQIIGWVKAAAGEIGADYIPDASHWIEGHPEWMAGDGLHPNDEGYAEMSRRMDDALTALGI
ncbi:MAG: SGNH/GDSL hydrolase family protein [Herbiconiux sp.]|uniref:SGNH/GDSL hydrolase family protein n=1 Tax=Herbiconiux sp. TaxID=1871186 RepID=UPI0011F8B89C|nr:SGNH/GDSL hydrolase family protein [Herbiconiux sp.]TAJ50278.1 MAG: SGNH/GDSL hydrolase family protein [Herbiconiux sp.]